MYDSVRGCRLWQAATQILSVGGVACLPDDARLVGQAPQCMTTPLGWYKPFLVF